MFPILGDAGTHVSQIMDAGWASTETKTPKAMASSLRCIVGAAALRRRGEPQGASFGGAS
jgi:hypothetical protein